jgi:hypothetical protein
MRHLSLASLALLLGLAHAHAADLLFSNLAPRVHKVVYDLPGIPAPGTMSYSCRRAVIGSILDARLAGA